MQTNPLAQALFGRAALQGRPSRHPSPTRPIGYDAGAAMESAAADSGYTGTGFQRMLAAYGFTDPALVTTQKSRLLMDLARCRAQARIWSEAAPRGAVEETHLLGERSAVRLFLTTVTSEHLHASALRSLDTLAAMEGAPQTPASAPLTGAVLRDLRETTDELHYRARVAEVAALRRGPAHRGLDLRRAASDMLREGADLDAALGHLDKT